MVEEARSLELEASGLMEVDTDCEKGRGNGVETPDEGEKDMSGNVEKLHSEKEGGCASPLKESVKGENLEILSEEKELLDPPNDANNLKPENLQKNVDAGEGSPDTADEENETEEESKDVDDGVGVGKELPFFEENLDESGTKNTRKSYSWETQYEDGYESGTEEEQNDFRREVETFYKESGLEFKAPKFYKGDVNLLKLYRVVLKLGGYEQVTSRKIWRNVGAPFNPPKTCTTVSWSFRIFYEKALLEYEKHRMRCGELPFTEDSYTAPKVENQVGVNQSSSGSGRAVRDAAARAMHVWNSPHMVDGEDGKSNFSTKSDRNQKSVGGLKRSRRPSTVEHTALRDTRIKAAKPQTNAVIIDAGPPADWVKINVYRIGDCFEVYALVPGLLREEVHVQSDPAGRLIITGQPRELDNPWGVTPFKKVVSLPSRIDPHQTSAVVTLTGQLFVRVPFEQTDMY